MGALRARDMLQQERQAWDFATTILSRRLFVYRAPSSAEEDMEAPGCRLPDIPGRLRSVRLRPTSPEKRLGLDETVALYDVATTYVSRDGGASWSADLVKASSYTPDVPWWIDPRMFSSATSAIVLAAPSTATTTAAAAAAAAAAGGGLSLIHI